MRILIFFVLFFSTNCYSNSLLDSLIHSSVDNIYNINFEAAQKSIDLVKENFPESPAGLFFDAMITWWKIQLDTDDDSYDEEFFKRADAVIEKCETILDKDEKNVDALFYEGGALGFKARVQTFRKQWIKAALNGKNAIPFVHGVYDLDHSNKDALLGLGIYNYFADVIPKRHTFVKPFMAFFPNGNAKKGIEELKEVSEHGKFANYEAQYQLLMIYYFYENDFKSGIERSKILVNLFPNNPIFLKYHIRFAYKLGRNATIDETFQQAIEHKKNNLEGFNNRTMTEFYYYASLQDYKKHKYNECLSKIEEIEKLSTNITKRKNNFFYINNLFNKGMVLYNKKEYGKARSIFQNIIKEDDFGNSVKRSETMLKKIKAIDSKQR